MHSPNLLELSAIEERLLLARLEAVRLAISHAGEKGRELEAEALGLSESDRAELLPSGVQTVQEPRRLGPRSPEAVGTVDQPEAGVLEADRGRWRVRGGAPRRASGRGQGSVGRPEVQAFYGALAGQRANKGVFITTSTFSQQAVEFARSVERVVLVDGERLAGLMMEHEVGVTLRPLKVPTLDSDYFEE